LVSKNLKTGEEKTIVADSDYGFSFITNEKYIFYSYYNGSNYSVYRVKMDGSDKTLVCKLRDISTMFSYYKGKLYYSAMLTNYDNENINLYSYNIKTKKKKKVSSYNFCSGTTYKNYIIGEANTGAPSLVPLASFNLKTNKAKLITLHYPSVGQYSIIGGKLYFIESTKKHDIYCYSKATFRLRKCNLSGAKKKTIGKKFVLKTEAGVTKITKKYVYYKSYNSNIIYRINVKTGKKTKV
jgi:hypothetical protein